MGWFLAVLALTYFGIGVFLAKRYYLRRHGVAATSGDRGLSTAGFIGLNWPLTVWFAAVRNPETWRIQAVIATQSFPANRRILPPVSATRVSCGDDR